MALSDDTLSFLEEPVGVLKFVLVCAFVTGVIAEILLKLIIAWVEKREWWPSAKLLQKALMMNFGQKEESCTDYALAGSYAYVIVLCGHHCICGVMMLPVVIYGWGGAQAMGQAAFVVGALMDVSIDVYDEFRMICTTFLYETVGKKLFGGEKGAKELFIVIGLLHHPLALTMVTPMVLYYRHLQAFHYIACSLLLAAGICFTTGNYKMTLDVKKPAAFYQFKAIVAVQAVTILFTRGYVWFRYVYVALTTFYDDNNMHIFYGGCVAATLMSLFNLVMIMDALGAAKKWLPRKMGTTEEDHAEVHEDIVKMMPPTPAKGTLKSSVTIGRNLGFMPEKTFRTDIKVVLAAVKFKRLSQRSSGKEPLLNTAQNA